MFCSQQAIEKMLKALIVFKFNSFPQRTHNLVQLLEAAKIELSEKDLEFIRELNFYYIQSRYPEERKKIGKGVTKKLAENTLRQTEELFKWLDSMLM